MSVLAYHITWTTYGTWLPGDARGWIQWGEFGIKPPDPAREREAGTRMVESAVLLTDKQRALVEQTVRDHCRIRGWLLHAVNARTNHVHAVVTADRDPQEVMNQLMAWCSRKLSDAAGLVGTVAKKAGRRHWFTEGGNKELIDNEEYLNNAIHYVIEGQASGARSIVSTQRKQVQHTPCWRCVLTFPTPVNREYAGLRARSASKCSPICF